VLDVAITLNGVADDGAAGEGDNVGPALDVEDVLGGDGDDLIAGNDNANWLDGGPGDDLLAGGDGPDTFAGESGVDVVSYVERTTPVSATIIGAPISGGDVDGPPGARDEIEPDVEILWGGSSNDILTGSNADNLLYGGDGADVLVGLGGDDGADYSDRTAGVTAALDGQPSSGNAADGPPGARDMLAADIEAIFGGEGNDTLTGSPLENYLDGAGGDDTLNSRDQAPDLLACGLGQDTALRDGLDDTDGTCEHVYLPGEEAQATTMPPPAIDTTPPVVRIAIPPGQRLRRTLRRGLSVAVTCSEPCTVRGRLVLDARTAHKLHFGHPTRPLQVAQGTAATDGRLVLRFTRAARRRLAHARRVTLTLMVEAADSSHKQAHVTKKVVVSPRGAPLGQELAPHLRGNWPSGAGAVKVRPDVPRDLRGDSGRAGELLARRRQDRVG